MGKCYQHSKEIFLKANGKPNHNPTEELVLYSSGPILAPPANTSTGSHGMNWDKHQMPRNQVNTSGRQCCHECGSILTFMSETILDSCLPSNNGETSYERCLLHAPQGNLSLPETERYLAIFLEIFFLVGSFIPPLVVVMKGYRQNVYVPPKIHKLKPNPKRNGIRRRGLWGVISSWKWSPNGGELEPLEQRPQERPCSSHHVRTQGGDGHLWAGSGLWPHVKATEALSLPSLKDCEK